MSRLVHNKCVRTLQKNNDSIIRLKESFQSVGYNPGYGAKFYVHPADMNGDVLLVTDEI